MVSGLERGRMRIGFWGNWNWELGGVGCMRLNWRLRERIRMVELGGLGCMRLNWGLMGRVGIGLVWCGRGRLGGGGG